VISLLLDVLQAVRLLLEAGADASQPLTHGVGTALCAAVSPASEAVRSASERLALVRHEKSLFLVNVIK